jgi:ABC-type nickel/cobalt efflux system permease component RcnA
LDEKNILKVYPFVYFIAFATYALILFIEKVAFNSHALIEHDHGNGDGHGHNHGHNHEDGNDKHNHNHKKGEVNRSKYELKSHLEKEENCKDLILIKHDTVF